MKKAERLVKAACANLCNPPNREPMDAKTEREKRLAEALRTNLRRRKAQARDTRIQDRDSPAPAPDAAPDAEDEDEDTTPPSA
jgi:hypothetical protein